MVFKTPNIAYLILFFVVVNSPYLSCLVRLREDEKSGKRGMVRQCRSEISPVGICRSVCKLVELCDLKR